MPRCVICDGPLNSPAQRIAEKCDGCIKQYVKKKPPILTETIPANKGLERILVEVGARSPCHPTQGDEVNKQWVVEVVNLRGEVVKSIPCTSERAAERTKRGVLINLNHAFFTRIEHKTKEPQP